MRRSITAGSALALAAVLLTRAPPANAASRFRQYFLPADSRPEAITAGPDGNMWFTKGPLYDAHVARVTPSGVITECAMPYPGAVALYGITAGPDGALWFTSFDARKIGRITTDGAITTFDLPAVGFRGNPRGITTGPDGNLWFAEQNDGGGGSIGRMTPGGTVTEFPIPTPLGGRMTSSPVQTETCGSPNGTCR